jgi:hypothetical protein
MGNLHGGIMVHIDVLYLPCEEVEAIIDYLYYHWFCQKLDEKI